MSARNSLRIPSRVPENRPGRLWLLVSGALALALGVVGVALTPVLTIAGTLTLGVALLGAAAYQLLQVLRSEGWRSRAARLGYAIAYAFGGGMMILNPAGAALGLTLVIAAGLLLAGFRGLFAGVQAYSRPGWAPRSALGLVAILGGTLLLLTWPTSSVWAIGLGLAVVMLTSGWRNLMMVFARRQPLRVIRRDDTLIA